MTVSVKVDTNFQRKALTERVNKAKRRLLYQFGGYASKTASRSMKPAPKRPTSTYGEYVEIRSGKRKGQKRFKRGQHSPEGKPPYYRNKARGLRTIGFDVNERRQEVKFGPVRLPGTSKQTSRLATKSQEFGGATTYRSVRRGVKPRRIFFKKRPFVYPAGMKSLKILISRSRGMLNG